jgi:hypothetical protein
MALHLHKIIQYDIKSIKAMTLIFIYRKEYIKKIHDQR